MSRQPGGGGGGEGEGRGEESFSGGGRHGFHIGESSSSSSSSLAARILRPRAHGSEVWPEMSLNNSEVWPEPFVEAVARQVALEAASGGGGMAAGPAVVTVFQVCSTWRTVSNSEILWEDLTLRVWGRHTSRHRREPTWREEYIRLHRTASNFLRNRAEHTLIEYETSSDSSGNGAAACRCLVLSENYLAVGFFDGAVRVFCLSSKECVSIMRPEHEQRMGPFSCAVAGIVLNDDKIVFASFNGSIFVGSVSSGDVRRAHGGNVVDDGTLVDFTGCEQFWVGLYAGNPGHACHIWDAVTGELLYNAGDITDPETLRGWHMLTEQAEPIGRVRIAVNRLLLTTTGSRLLVTDLETYGVGFRREEITNEQLIVEAVDVSSDRFLSVTLNGSARVRRIANFDDVCRFQVVVGADDNGNNSSGSSSGSINNNNGKIHGALNTWLAFVCVDGVVHVWDANTGLRVHRLTEQMGDVYHLVADDEHVAGCASDTGIHLWSFRP